MTYFEIIENIKGFLKTKTDILQLDIQEGTSRTPDEIELNEERGCVVISYAGSPNSEILGYNIENKIRNIAQQKETLNFMIMVGYRTIVDPNNSFYKIVEFVKENLNGYDVQGLEAFVLINNQEPKLVKNNWWLFMRFQTRMINVIRVHSG